MLLLARILLNGLAVLVIAALVPGVAIHGYVSAIFAGLAIAVVNAMIRPVLQILALPVTILTFGFFSLIINALMFWLASAFVPGFEVTNFAAAFWGAIVFWILSLLINGFLKHEDTPEIAR